MGEKRKVVVVDAKKVEELIRSGQPLKIGKSLELTDERNLTIIGPNGKKEHIDRRFMLRRVKHG